MFVLYAIDYYIRNVYKSLNEHLLSKFSDDLVEKCILKDVSNYICNKCERHLKSNKLPPMAITNKIEVFSIADELTDFSELESRLIAQRIPFMKFLSLPKGKQRAIIGSVVNEPVDASETIATLPRCASSSGFIPLKLKRKQSYTGHVLYQMVRPKKIESALTYLKANNVHYSSIILNNSWQKKFQHEDTELREAFVKASPKDQNVNVFGENESEENHEDKIMESQIEDSLHGSYLSEGNNNEHRNPQIGNGTSKNQQKQHEECMYINNQNENNQIGISTEMYNNVSLNGIQFDTCIQTEDLANIAGNEVFSIAPGEGRLPLHVFNDVNNEVLTFPNLFPTGQYGFDVLCSRRITLRKYFQARLLSHDNRFVSNTEYLFYS